MLTPAELAAHFRVSERTVARMVDDGCPSMLVGSRRRFDLAAVTAWTQERAACQPEKMPRDTGTPRLASAVAAYTDDCRRVQLRVMPSS
jgi:excisionase family DNA binding protein